jgi:D-sedoheptulose 7-phosphate isomerase
MSFSEEFLVETNLISELMWYNSEQIERAVRFLRDTRNHEGRLFILGVGGSAANASHAVNDFRKICGFEAYAPTDNVAELTARTNDDGWNTFFKSWLCGNHLNAKDTVLILSVGGGDREKGISVGLIDAIDYARGADAEVIGIVGRDGGYTAKMADVCIVVPTVNSEHVTPHTETFQMVILHLIVSHPLLKQKQTKWESVS